MRYTVDDVVLEPPHGFVKETSTASFRVAADQGFADERIETGVRPNLVVHRKAVPEGQTLSQVVAAVTAELLRSLPGLGPIEVEEIEFGDGARGAVLALTFPAARVPDLLICQLQALRVDGATLTTLTLTTARDHLTEQRKAAYLASLASTRLDSAQEGETT